MLRVDPVFAGVARREAQKAGSEYTNTVNGLDKSHPSYDSKERAAWRRFQKSLTAIERRYGVKPQASVTRKPKR